jgi:large subunit ribosomal protein L5
MADKKSTPKAKNDVAVYEARLKTLYTTKMVSELKTELSLDNIMDVPKLYKIVVNCGLGKAKDDKKMIEVATNTLRKVTGQNPVETIAKTSIATFKLREGQKIGIKVTLRGNMMYDMADRLINIVIPRIRDFHGVNENAFDAQGNYSIGFPDQSVFPELTYEETTTAHGLQFVFCIKAKNKEHAKALLTKMNMPFQKGAR